MAAEPVEKVALLALVYRELYNARHTGPNSLLDDFESCPGEVSLLGMMGSQSLSELDWFVIEAMEDPETLPALASDLAALDPVRSEALLHAWPLGEQMPAVRSLAEFNRWEEVETAMREFSELGVTMSRSDVDALARRSYAQATGQRLEDVLDEWCD
jgi:hypothetical protein